MKKIVLAVVAVMLFSATSFSQVRFGVKGGLNFSNFATESSLINSVKGSTNYSFGVLFQGKSMGFAVQPEVLYSVKGGSFGNDALLSLFSGAATEYKSQSIEVPVNLQYGVDLLFARLYLQAGPYVAFTSKVLIDGDADFYDDNKDNFNTIDYGVGVGAGAEFMGLQLSAKYDWGLAPLGKEIIVAGVNTNPLSEIKNRNFSVSLAYLF